MNWLYPLLVGLMLCGTAAAEYDNPYLIRSKRQHPEDAARQVQLAKESNENTLLVAGMVCGAIVIAGGLITFAMMRNNAKPGVSDRREAAGTDR